jgi:signal transduction histidine kinase
MKFQLALYFYILATMQSSMLLSLYHSKQEAYIGWSNSFALWTYSLSASCIGLILFGTGVFFVGDIKTPPLIYSISNTLLFSASTLQMLFCISLRRSLTKKTNYKFIALTIIFLLIFEYLRQTSNYEFRTITMCIVTLILYLLQIFNLFKIKNEEENISLLYLKIATYLEVFFVLCRLYIVCLPNLSVHNLSDVPSLLIFFTLMQYTMNTLSYMAISIFWSIKNAFSTKQIKLENDRISNLLDEKNNLISTLSRVNKTATTGALSATLAHELNQPLGASRIKIQYLLLKTSKNKSITEEDIGLLEALEKDNTRASQIIKSIQSIFSKDSYNQELTSLQLALDEVLVLVQPDLDKNQITLKLDPVFSFYIMINQVQLRQVLLNLFTNSINSLKNISSRQRVIQIESEKVGDIIKIKFYDNGQGIDYSKENELFNIFQNSQARNDQELFNSLENEKSNEIGMGIGLWLCQHILSAHKGSIHFERQKVGALFIIQLPQVH